MIKKETVETIYSEMRKKGFYDTMVELEVGIIECAMKEGDHKKQRAAGLLRLNRTTLFEKMKKFGVQDSFGPLPETREE